jgi:hypothetical protein
VTQLRCFGEDNDDPESNSWIKAYVDLQSLHSESPKQFHFWSAVSAIAGALRRQVWIDQRQFQWTPNMYIVLVGPPGVAAKSTSMKGALSLLELVEGVSFGPQSMTWQALIGAFKRSLRAIPVTGLADPVSMSCLTVGVSELGNFLDPKDRALVDFLTDIWDGQRGIWRREIKKEGLIELHSPWLNLIACTTPSWLGENFQESLIGGGLTSRIVFVFGATKDKIIPYPSQILSSEEFENGRKYLLQDLQQISEMAGEYQMDPDALAWGDAWYRKFQNGGLPAHLASSRFEGYVARKQSHIHKLAMVFAASKRNDLRITKSDLVEAEAQITFLENEMLKVFENIGVAPQARVTNNVIKLVQTHKQIDYLSLWKLCIKTMDGNQFKYAVEGGVQAGVLHKTVMPGNNWLLTYKGELKK